MQKQSDLYILGTNTSGAAHYDIEGSMTSESNIFSTSLFLVFPTLSILVEVVTEALSFFDVVVAVREALVVGIVSTTVFFGAAGG